MDRVIVNGVERALPAQSSVAELVESLGLSGKPIAIEHNGLIVPRSRYAETRLREGDRVEIVGAVGGG